MTRLEARAVLRFPPRLVREVWMQGCGRRSVTRALVVLAAAAIAFCASTVSSLAAGSPLSLSVQVGYHNHLKVGQWMPVAVDITNNGPDFEGTLEVQPSFGSGGGPPIGATVYQAPVSLASGATKHFRTYVSQDFPGAIEVRVVQGGRVVARQEAASTNTFSGLMIGVLSDVPTTLDTLGSIQPGGTQPLVVHLGAADLPDFVPVLRAFDVIAVDDFASDTLTSGQKTALGDYVVQGGSLLLGTGGAWRKTLAGIPAGLVPMQVTGTAILSSVAALNTSPSTEVATGTLSPGATPWLAQGGVPLIVEAPAGKGMVSLATFDWNAYSIGGKSIVLRQTLVRLTYGSLSNPASTGPMVAKLGAGTTVSVATKGGALGQALGAVPALDLPAWWLIGGLVFAYVLLVGPVNYFVLRAIGRRALAWITVPTIALVASAGAYGTSVATKGTSVLANEVSVIHVEPGSQHAYQEEYTGIIAPTRGDYDVAIGNTRTLVSPIYYYNGNFSDPNFGAMRVNTTSSDVALPGMTAFTLRGFANEGTMANAPNVTGQAQLVGGQLTGAIKNASSLEFTDGVVISGSSYQKLGGLGPGATASFSLQPSTASSFGGPPVSMTIYPSNFQFNGAYPNNASDVEREMETRSAIISTLVPNAFGGLPYGSEPVVLLWTRQPFQSVTVNGAHPRTYVESAVVLTLPIERVGPGSLPGGVVQARLVDLDADTSSGPPGMVTAQSGSITYDFAPSLAPGSRLGAASITSMNPFGAKGIGPAGTTGPVKVEAWDWTQSTWVELNYQESGLTAVPDSAVNPASGEVLMRISSTGQFSTGWLSLTGTVT
jgi:hypothetical protein